MGCMSTNAQNGRRCFPTLWGTPWDGVSKYPHKSMSTQLLTALVVLTLPERAIASR